MHIPQESRLTVSTQRKRSGRPRRPVHTLKSVVSNLHLLTGVPSFARWPLSLHFRAGEAHAAWEGWVERSQRPCRPGLTVVKDFEATAPAAGIQALPVDYGPMRDYVAKAQDVVAFEREGKCVHCRKKLSSGRGLHAMCPGGGCTAMGHLDCWSRHALSGDGGGDDIVIPDLCACPSCGGEFRWADMMKELSLRIRGGAEVAKLLKSRRRAGAEEA
ncbi:hypothetical protein CDD83_9352 [Cordyceps sp. RAO-2017]|nr:hypothetical protein CDD83_9352 [Cordyceps sp. RAO-2017]